MNQSCALSTFGLTLTLVGCGSAMPPAAAPTAAATPTPAARTPRPVDTHVIAYVADEDRLRAYVVDSATGDVEPIADVALGGPGSAARVFHSADGTLLAVLLRKHRVYKYSDEWLAMFRLAPDGVPSHVVTVAVGASDELGTDAVFSGGFVHLVSRAGGFRSFNVDPQNPVPVPVEGLVLSLYPSAVAVNAALGLLALGGDSGRTHVIGLYRDSATGPQPIMTATDAGAHVSGLAFEPDGSRLHAAQTGTPDGQSDRVFSYSIDSSNQLSLRDQLTPRGLCPCGLAALQRTLFLTHEYDAAVDGFRVDPQTARLDPLGIVASAGSGTTLASEPLHRLVAMRETPHVALWHVGDDSGLTLAATLPAGTAVDLLARR